MATTVVYELTVHMHVVLPGQHEETRIKLFTRLFSTCDAAQAAANDFRYGLMHEKAELKWSLPDHSPSGSMYAHLGYQRRQYMFGISKMLVESM